LADRKQPFATVSSAYFRPSQEVGGLQNQDWRAFWYSASVESATVTNATGVDDRGLWAATSWGNHWGYSLRCVYP